MSAARPSTSDFPWKQGQVSLGDLRRLLFFDCPPDGPMQIDGVIWEPGDRGLVVEPGRTYTLQTTGGEVVTGLRFLQLDEVLTLLEAYPAVRDCFSGPIRVIYESAEQGIIAHGFLRTLLAGRSKMFYENMLQMATDVVQGCGSFSELRKMCGLDKADAKEGSLHGFLGNVRALIVLSLHGYEELELIRPSTDSRNPDIRARREGVSLFEVKTLWELSETGALAKQGVRNRSGAFLMDHYREELGRRIGAKIREADLQLPHPALGQGSFRRIPFINIVWDKFDLFHNEEETCEYLREVAKHVFLLESSPPTVTEFVVVFARSDDLYNVSVSEGKITVTVLHETSQLMKQAYQRNRDDDPG